jgi:hypothetical protein
VHHPVYAVFGKDLPHGFLVGDVRFDERVVAPSRNVLQVLGIARIRERVQVDDPDLIPVFSEHVMNEIGSDETASACYKIGGHAILLPI